MGTAQRSRSETQKTATTTTRISYCGFAFKTKNTRAERLAEFGNKRPHELPIDKHIIGVPWKNCSLESYKDCLTLPRPYKESRLG